MATAASPTGGEKKKEDDRKKLTKVLFTKVSTEDYIDLRSTQTMRTGQE